MNEEQIREILERAHGTKKKKEPFKPEMLKQRHLTKDERLALHKPKPDWVLTGGGEVCRSTCVLEVDDLLSLIKTD